MPWVPDLKGWIGKSASGASAVVFRQTHIEMHPLAYTLCTGYKFLDWQLKHFVEEHSTELKFHRIGKSGRKSLSCHRTSAALLDRLLEGETQEVHAHWQKVFEEAWSDKHKSTVLDELAKSALHEIDEENLEYFKQDRERLKVHRARLDAGIHLHLSIVLILSRFACIAHCMPQ